VPAVSESSMLLRAPDSMGRLQAASRGAPTRLGGSEPDCCRHPRPAGGSGIVSNDSCELPHRGTHCHRTGAQPHPRRHAPDNFA
jgi:hypothetical protein